MKLTKKAIEEDYKFLGLGSKLDEPYDGAEKTAKKIQNQYHRKEFYFVGAVDTINKTVDERG